MGSWLLGAQVLGAVMERTWASEPEIGRFTSPFCHLCFLCLRTTQPRSVPQFTIHKNCTDER